MKHMKQVYGFFCLCGQFDAKLVIRKAGNTYKCDVGKLAGLRAQVSETSEGSLVGGHAEGGGRAK